MINVYFGLLLSTISGTIAYVMWLITTLFLDEKNRLRCIYPMTLLVTAFYLVPCIALWIVMLFSVDMRNLSDEALFLWTPSIVKWREILAYIWLFGAIVQAAWQSRRLIGMRRHLGNNIYSAEDWIVEWKDSVQAELGLHGRIDVYKSLVITSPMVEGVFRRRILLPDREYEPKEIEAIVYHEMVHIKQGVLLVKAVIVMLQIIQWFNPFVYSLLSSLDEWSEISCDLYVHYNTKCTLSFKEYFDVVLDGLEFEQAALPSSMTQLRRKKGVAKRVDKVKKYKREKDFKLTGSLLTLATFVALSTSTAVAAEIGIEKAHEALYEMTEEKVVLDGIDSNNISEENMEAKYAGMFEIDEETMIELPSKERAGNNFTFEDDVQAGKLGYTKLFKVNEGGKINVFVSVEPDDVTVEVGIITPNGTKICVTGKDAIFYTFTADSSGNYRVYVDNDNSIPVTVVGTVAY